MKTLIKFVTALTILAAAITARADLFYSGYGTGVSTTLCYNIVPPKGALIPCVQYINVTSDKAASVIQFYTAGTPVVITATQSYATNILTAVGTGFSGSDVVVVWHKTSGTFERGAVSSAGATSITLSANLGTKATAGDLIYKMTASGSIPVGAATKELNAPGGAVFTGQGSNKPILIDIDGTSACKINAVCVVYRRNEE